MNQSQGGNPFGRLVEFARPHKTATSFLLFLLCWELPLVSSPILQQLE